MIAGPQRVGGPGTGGGAERREGEMSQVGPEQPLPGAKQPGQAEEAVAVVAEQNDVPRNRRVQRCRRRTDPRRRHGRRLFRDTRRTSGRHRYVGREAKLPLPPPPFKTQRTPN